MKKFSILLTGGAGFIGSHIAEALLSDSRVQQVRILDDLSTGCRTNLEHLRDHPQCQLLVGDIREEVVCLEACQGMDLVCHQAALGSVPRSIQFPLLTNAVNVTGTLNVFAAARQTGIKRVVYAASSSAYGDSPVSPRQEAAVGRPISPYAVSKLTNELYAHAFAGLYDMEFIGLRYFNVFGPRQNPEGPYAAVIPQFIRAMKDGRCPEIHGDGLQTRDFTFVANAVQANILALFTERQEALNQVYNIAGGEEISILNLYESLRQLGGFNLQPQFAPTRQGDVRHSVADISKARDLLGYEPVSNFQEGLHRVWQWFSEKVGFVAV